MKYKNLIYKEISNFKKLISFSAPPTGHRVLMYHALDTQKFDNPFSVPLSSFEAQMQSLKNAKHINIIDFAQTKWDDTKLNISVTFDDGYLDNLELAAPVLVKLGIPFTVFVATDKILENSPGWLDKKSLLELSTVPGCTIGFHGASHSNMSTLSEAEVHDEFLRGTTLLKEIINYSPKVFAYPYGKMSPAVWQACRKFNYIRAGNSEYKINSASTPSLLFGRVEINRFDDESSFWQKIEGKWDWMHFLQKFKKSLVLDHIAE